MQRKKLKKKESQNTKNRVLKDSLPPSLPEQLF